MLSKLYRLCILGSFVICFFCTETSADDAQRLLIPRIKKPVNAKNGEIELPAFCTDISRNWPKTGSILNNVYWGGKETILKITINGTSKDMTLHAAVFVYHFVKLVADHETIFIRKTGPNLKLLHIRSAGFLIGITKEPPPVTMEKYIESLPALITYDKNEHISYSMRYQQDWWRIIYETEKLDVTAIKKRIQEISLRHFKKKGMEITEEASSKIKLFDRGKNLKVISDFYSRESLDLYQLERLKVEKYQEMEVCLNFNPSDSSLLSFSISGKYKNVLPFEIEYSSTNEIVVTSSFKKEVELTSDVSIDANIAIVVEPKQKTTDINYPLKECKLEYSGSICFPGGIIVDVKLCGINVSIKPVSFGFK